MNNESPPEKGTQPVEEPENALPEISINDLPEPLRLATERAGWKSLMPVQARAMPYLLAGRDVMVQSRTGTGKTGAFLLPILQRIDPKKAVCQALILVPTRELARQVYSDAEALTGDTGVRAVAVYGGTGYGPQLDAFRKGAHLVVGTPGRILDHLMRRSLVLKDLNILVFDEADRMLSMGFYPDMKALEKYLPNRRDGFMFSATYPNTVRYLAEQFLDKPAFLSLSYDGEHVADNQHIYYEVSSMEKDRALVRIIEIENPDSAIIFCNTKANVNFVSVVLRRFGYDADQLSSDLAQGAREAVLARVYDKKLRFLVATDVAARGIDITNLSHVFLYDFPEDHESYIHRTGRTGRAGECGTAVSLVGVLERVELKGVAKRYGIVLEKGVLPTDEDVQAVVSDRVTALLEAKLRGLDNLVRERMARMMPLARKLAYGEEDPETLAMLLDEYYQKTLHSPPEMPLARARRISSGPGHSSGKGKPRSRSGRSRGGRSRR